MFVCALTFCIVVGRVRCFSIPTIDVSMDLSGFTFSVGLHLVHYTCNLQLVVSKTYRNGETKYNI